MDVRERYNSENAGEFESFPVFLDAGPVIPTP